MLNSSLWQDIGAILPVVMFLGWLLGLNCLFCIYYLCGKSLFCLQTCLLGTWKIFGWNVLLEQMKYF